MDKIELFGDEYISQYISQCADQEAKQEFYQIYVTDALNTICECTAHTAQFKYQGKRYYDYIKPVENDAPDVSMNAETIINNIMNEINGMRGEKE